MQMQAFFQNGDEQVNGDGAPDLGAHRVGAGAIKGFDTQMLLDPFEEQFDLPAATIQLGNGQRWQVELFFRWIKQHLRVKAFFGTNQNAVKTQIWIAVSVYVLVAIARKRLGIQAGLHQILQILSLTLFEKTPILRTLQRLDADLELDDNDKQLILFML